MRRTPELILFLLGLLTQAACRAPEIVYIGLVAPFEGRDRAIGYDAIFGARLAVRAWNAAHPEGPFVMLAALDDQGDPALAQERARQVIAHPRLIAVIGHFRPETTAAAAPIYRGAGIPLIAPLLPADRAPEGARPIAPDQLTMIRALLDALPPGAGRRFWIVRDGEEQWFGPEAEAFLRAQGWVVQAAGWGEASPQGEEPVLWDGRAVHAVEAVRRWRWKGWRGPLLGGPGLLHPDAMPLRSAGGMRVVAETRPVDDPGWVAAYRELSLGIPPGPYAPLGYDLVWVLLRTYEAHTWRWEGWTGVWEMREGQLRKTPALWVTVR